MGRVGKPLTYNWRVTQDAIVIERRTNAVYARRICLLMQCYVLGWDKAETELMWLESLNSHGTSYQRDTLRTPYTVYLELASKTRTNLSIVNRLEDYPQWVPFPRFVKSARISSAP